LPHRAPGDEPGARSFTVLGFVRGTADNRGDDRVFFGTLRGKAHPAPEADLHAEARRSSEGNHEYDDHTDHGVLLPLVDAV
jgi:hypothetical protein